MQNKHRFLQFSLAGILAALLLSAASIPASSDRPAESKFYESRQDNLLSGSEQTSPCMALLMEAVKQAGVTGTLYSANDRNVYENGDDGCDVMFNDMDTGGVSHTSTNLGLFNGYPSTEEECVMGPSAQGQPTTFHGYEAVIYDIKDTNVNSSGEPGTFEWKIIDWVMYKGGLCYSFRVSTSSQKIEEYGIVDPLPIAEVLWSLAEDRLPLSEVPVDGAEQPALPVEPEEVIPDQPEVPTDNSTPAETGGLFGIPIPIILGSLGIPIAGAAAGAILSALMSGLSSAAVSSPGAIPGHGIQANDQGLYWSERPWDEAGPGYVSKEEYERTKDMLAQGYKWTKDGWQTPDQSQQSHEWDAKDREALKREDADWKAKGKAELEQLELEQQKERTRLIESYLPPYTPAAPPAAAEPESPWQVVDHSLEAGGGGDLGTGTIDPNLGGSVTFYKDAYYDMPDKKDDLSLLGWDIGNYKCDVQVGKVQAAGGGSINPEKPESRQVGFGGSASAIQLTGEGVIGNKYLGITFDSTVDGPKGESFVGIRDGAAGGAIGVSAGSVDLGLGVNAAGVNVSGRVGLNAGMEFGLKLGAKGEVKLGPFKFGYSLGWAKTGT